MARERRAVRHVTSLLKDRFARSWRHQDVAARRRSSFTETPDEPRPTDRWRPLIGSHRATAVELAATSNPENPGDVNRVP